MKLMVLSATHNVGGARGPIYELFCKRMKLIRDKFGVETLVVGSEGAISRKPTEDNGHIYVEHENNPVSMKWNAGMEALREHSPTHVMIMGSDDFVSDSLIQRYCDLIATDEYNVIGITDSYYASYNTGRAHFGQCLYWSGYNKPSIIGYCKTMSAELMDAVGWHPWPDGKNVGLDMALNRVLQLAGAEQVSKRFYLKDNDDFHIDIKTRGNISSLSPILRRSTEIDLDIDALLSKYLPEEIASEIMVYLNKVTELYNAGKR